jgi:coenzyme F420-0:L-glutamate ligase/coenzyme F420-1:gamma-L-glutamate ligase
MRSVSDSGFADPANMGELTDADRGFLDSLPVARLATADGAGRPHAVPICFVVIEDTFYFAIDQKPKSGDVRKLKRLRNIANNPRVAVIADRYDADWGRLGWVMIRGCAEVIGSGDAYELAQAALVKRYPPYAGMDLTGLPVVAIRIEQVTRWGNLAVET